MSNRDFASKQLNMIRNRIKEAAFEANRDPTEIELIGASKQHSATLVNDFYHAGLTTFGENYLQEALVKQKELQREAINWHFIGRIQSNKCKIIAQHFDWVHSVDQLKTAKRLSRFRLEGDLPPLNLLVQINIDKEENKGGVSISDVSPLCAQIGELEGVYLRGFMLIPAPTIEKETQKQTFALARETLDVTNQQLGLELDTLSMGMSNDLEAAIEEGSTMIRIGTALFGPRTPISN